MKYFFILGSNPTLSLAELTAVFPDGQFSLVQKDIAVLEITRKINAKIIKRIGGTIKFGLLNNELASSNAKDILRSVSFAMSEKAEGKFYFGISHYGRSKLNLKVLGMEFKKLLKQSGTNSRWVTSKEPTLSSVVVEQNKLTSERGVEIVLIEFNKKLLVGKTLAVQPFKELSFRDYGRPARDDRSGMLPPKLAQIMINLAGATADVVILDPFCGSGTILTEAVLMGFQHLTGADISEKAIADTRQNIEWIKKNYELRDASYELREANASQLSKHIAPNSIDAIVTEPYLGPQRGLIEINKIIRELENLYSDSLREFHKILKPGGRIVMIWPVFQRKQSTFISPNTSGYKIINPVPYNLQKNIFLKLTNRPSIVYGRDGQKVWREIVVLKND